MAAATAGKSLLIKQTKSLTQTHSTQKKIMKAIGLRGVGKSVYRKDTRAIRGMLNLVRHLITAEQVDASASARPKKAKAGSAKGYTLG